MSPDIIKGNTVTITKLAQTYRAGKIPVRWLLQFSDATDCLDDNRKEDAVFYEVCVHRKHCSTFLYCSPYEACHRNSTWRRKVIKNFHRAFLFLVWLNQGLRFCEKTIFSFSQIIFDYRSHGLYLNLNDQKTSHFYWCIPGMLGTHTIPK